MAPKNLCQTPLENGNVQRSFEVENDRDVVKGAAPLELVEEPETLLSER